MPYPYDPKTMNRERNVGRLIARVRHALLRAIDNRLAPLGLTAAQWTAVVYVAEGVAATPAELADLLDYDRGAMTRLIDRLEVKGVVQRVPAPHDRRSVRIELTDAGKKAYPEIRPFVVDVLNRKLAGFTTAEVAQFEHLLARMLANE